MKSDDLRAIMETVEFGRDDIDEATSDLEMFARDEKNEKITKALDRLKHSLSATLDAYWLLEEVAEAFEEKEKSLKGQR